MWVNFGCRSTGDNSGLLRVPSGHVLGWRFRCEGHGGGKGEVSCVVWGANQSNDAAGQRLSSADGGYLQSPSRFACSVVLTFTPPLAFAFAVRTTKNELLLSVPSTRTELYLQSEE